MDWIKNNLLVVTSGAAVGVIGMILRIFWPQIKLFVLKKSHLLIHSAYVALVKFAGTTPSCVPQDKVLDYLAAQRQVIAGAVRMIEILMPDSLGADKKAAVIARLTSWGLAGWMAMNIGDLIDAEVVLMNQELKEAESAV